MHGALPLGSRKSKDRISQRKLIGRSFLLFGGEQLSVRSRKEDSISVKMAAIRMTRENFAALQDPTRCTVPYGAIRGNKQLETRILDPD